VSTSDIKHSRMPGKPARLQQADERLIVSLSETAQRLFALAFVYSSTAIRPNDQWLK
jgi:hypothetical protein